MTRVSLRIFLTLVLLSLGLSGGFGAEPLKVVTKPVEPFSFTENGKIVGFSIDLWEAVTKEVGLEYQLENLSGVPQLLDALSTKKADVAVAALSITAERYAMMDFSQPFYESGLQIMVAGGSNNGNSTASLINAFFNWTAFKVVAVLMLVMLAISHVVWWFERKHNAEMYPEHYGTGIWESFWWTISILFVGGCESKGPMGIPGRIIAIAWMLASIVLISFFTASITTEMTVNSLTGEINGPADLPGRKVATIAGSTAEKWLNANKSVVSAFPDIKAAIAALNGGQVKAVVYDAPILKYFLVKNPSTRLQLVGQTFEKQFYGFGLQQESPLRRPINRALLSLNERGFIDGLQKKWFAASAE
jgi:polar amino acid transport system substrate-binding protein